MKTELDGKAKALDTIIHQGDNITCIHHRDLRC